MECPGNHPKSSFDGAYLVWLLKAGKGWNMLKRGFVPNTWNLQDRLCTPRCFGTLHFSVLGDPALSFSWVLPSKMFYPLQALQALHQWWSKPVGFHERPVRMLSHGPCPVGCWRILKLPERMYLRVWSTRRLGDMMKCAPIAGWRNNQMSTLRYWKVWKCNGDEENTFFFK